MKCIYCEQEGKESTLVAGPTSHTDMGGPPHYHDERGNLHNHDPNYYTTDYKCSNGHEYRVVEKMKCPSCNYGGERRVHRFVVMQPTQVRGASNAKKD